MALIFLALALAALPLMLSSSFTRLALVSTYLGLAHLLVMAGILLMIWFSLRCEAICRVLRRRTR